MNRAALFATILLGVSYSTGQAQERGPDHQFTIHSASLNGGGGNPIPGTIMLDGKTGQAWFFVVIDQKIQWVPVPFSAKLPPNSLPTLAEPGN